MIRPMSTAVVSPYAPPARPSERSLPLDTVTLSGWPVEEPAPLSRHRALGFALVSFVTTLMGMAAPPLAHAAATQSQAGIGLGPFQPQRARPAALGENGTIEPTTKAQQPTRPGPATPPADTLTVAQQKNVLIDRMLARGHQGRCLTPKARQGVRDELKVLPRDVLGALDRNGTAVAVLCEGETPMDAGVIKDVDLDAAYRDAARLKAAADGAVQRVEKRFEKRIDALEREQEAPEGVGSAEGETGMHRIQELEARREQAIAEALDEATGGAVELFTPRSLDDPAEEAMAAIRPMSLNDLARAHGATTPQEVSRFTGLVRALNGGRLAEAQRRYAEESQEKLRADGDDRRFYPVEDRILIPAYHHEGGRVLSSHDVHSLDGWDGGDVLGQYWYQPGRNTVVVREDQLGNFVLVHELGHAYEDAAQDLDPAGYQRFRAQRDAAFERLTESPENAFSDYALANPAEFVAESFATKFADDPAVLRESDPAWARVFDGFIHRAGALKQTRP